MSLGERVDYRVGLLAISGALTGVPLVDVRQDVAAGKTLASAVLENSVVVALTLAFVSLSVWLFRVDWEDGYVQSVARWSTLGTVAVALVFAWIVGFQLLAQNDLKPYIIAADGVVIAGILLFVAGVYNARSRMESAARAAERDRAAALFENTSDAVAGVAVEDGTAVVTEVNDSFGAAFDAADAPVGRPVAEVVAAATAGTPDGGAGSDAATDGAGRAATAPADRVRRVVGDPSARAELRVGERDFVVTYVAVDGAPTGRDPGFLIFTDITRQRERERRFERLSTGAEDLVDARSVDGMLDALRTLAADLFADATAEIWAYDADADAYRPRRATAADADAAPASARGERDAAPSPDAVRAAADRVLDGGDAASAADRDAVETALVRRLTDDHLLVVTRAAEGGTTAEADLLDLLAADARAVAERIDREERLTRRNDQLEFVNSLLRHDVHNSVTVIRARGAALAEACEGREADYARTVVSQSDDIASLIDRFRDLLDALTGEETERVPVDLAAVVEDRVAAARSTYPDADISADAPDEVAVAADDLLENVVANLIRNAVEHNDTDAPTVTVSVTADDDAATLTVADDGPGVPDDQKDAVFRRGDRGLKASDVGSGFGLFFVDTLVDGYGGSVTVADNEPRGAVFEVTLPRASAAADGPAD